jgi:hypothetical protein
MRLSLDRNVAVLSLIHFSCAIQEKNLGLDKRLLNTCTFLQDLRPPLPLEKENPPWEQLEVLNEDHCRRLNSKVEING